MSKKLKISLTHHVIYIIEGNEKINFFPMGTYPKYSYSTEIWPIETSKKSKNLDFKQTPHAAYHFVEN